MKKKEFLMRVKKELNYEPYRGRFLEELGDHWEDLENEITQKTPLEKIKIKGLMEQYFGEPKLIRNHFISIMNPFKKIFSLLEAIFFGIILLPLTALLEAPSNFIIFSNEQFPITYILTYGLTLSGILFFFYWICFRRYQELEFNADKNPIGWFLIIFLMNLATYLILLLNKSDSSIQKESLILGIVFYIILNISLAFFSWKTLSIKNNLTLENKTIHRFHLLKTILLTYLFLSIIIRTILINSMHPDEPLIESISPFISVISPILPLELYAYDGWQKIIALNKDINILITFYTPIILMLVVGLQSAWVIFRQKKWFSFRSLIVFYVVSLFLIKPDGLIKKPEFLVPAINVSTFIEKNQLGVFYPVFKYFNYKGGQFYKYEIGFRNDSNPKKEGFLIKSNSENFTFIPYNPLSQEEVQFNYNYPKTDLPSMVNLPRNYYYDRKNSTNKNFNAFIEAYLVKNMPKPASGAVFSKDGKWGLISLSSYPNSPEQVYLVNLEAMKVKSSIK